MCARCEVRCGELLGCELYPSLGGTADLDGVRELGWKLVEAWFFIGKYGLFWFRCHTVSESHCGDPQFIVRDLIHCGYLSEVYKFHTFPN